MKKIPTKESEVFSIEELISELTSNRPWKLSIAQRSFEWDKLRITNLIDSILRGFPIGSILIMESKSPYYGLDPSKRLHEKVKNPTKRKNIHIIDGQQRCIAILATFDGEGIMNEKKPGKEFLWINLIKENYEYKEFDEKRGQKYFFHWSKRKDINGLTYENRKAEKLPPGSPENGWIVFHELVKVVKNGEVKDKIYRAAKLNIQDIEEEALSKIIDSVKKASRNKRIPIHLLNEEEIDLEDIYHLFIRINTGGLPLSQVDVFFTGVKKYWDDAEEHLQCIVNENTIFERREAITLLARCAGMSLNEKPFDPVRLRLRNLKRNASNGEYPLIKRMQELTPQNRENDFIKAVIWTSNLVKSYFFYASNIINRFSIMPIIAWAYQYEKSEKLPELNHNTDIKGIISYLFWTSVFKSRYYGRTKFDRETFRIAWESGKEHEIFPYSTELFQDMCFDYTYVQRRIPNNPNLTTLKWDKRRKEYDDAKKIFDITKTSKELFLSIYQKIEHHSIDWDHLIAYNFARNRFKKGRTMTEENREHMKLINMIGNFAGIDSRANRILKDKPPSYKFRNQNKENIDTYDNSKFIKTIPCITKNDISLCKKVEKLLKYKSKGDAGEILNNFVADRTIRIWRNVIEIVGSPPEPFE